MTCLVRCLTEQLKEHCIALKTWFVHGYQVHSWKIQKWKLFPSSSVPWVFWEKLLLQITVPCIPAALQLRAEPQACCSPGCKESCAQEPSALPSPGTTAELQQRLQTAASRASCNCRGGESYRGIVPVLSLFQSLLCAAAPGDDHHLPGKAQ